MPSAAALPRFTEDPYLAPYLGVVERRAGQVRHLRERLTAGGGSLAEFANAHEFYGLHRHGDLWIFREWAPNATDIYLIGDFSDWERREEFRLHPQAHGVWSLEVPAERLAHGQHYRLDMLWDGGHGERIPAYARRVVQDPQSLAFTAQVWDPEPYCWVHAEVQLPAGAPLIYETHIGMAQEQERVGTFDEFRENVLPRIVKAGYNTLQIMALMEHPYYGSFGYQVSSFFAASSRFGTPEALKALVDAAHGAGLRVIMDLVHSHAVRNEREGLSRFDGTEYQYFHDGSRGWHDAWDSRCFDYGRVDVLHFLLSNCRFWLDEFRLDGFRFDGVTSMLYLHHGMGVDFGRYAQYYDDAVDEDAWSYLALANEVIHAVRPDAMTVAEDVSGMPGLAAPVCDGGAGFDYRMAMGVPECWFKLIRDVRDEDWSIGYLWHELTNRRDDERTVNYAECHDQAIVGGKTVLFQMTDSAIYDGMHRGAENLVTERAVALHKMIRLATLGSAGHAYLNFMGNEFGHPEWIDFPREGNGFSYHYARRLWHLRDDAELNFSALGDFDEAMLAVFSASAALDRTQPRRLVADDRDKLLVFGRGDLILCFNFHNEHSLREHAIIVPPGSYELMLSSDDVAFGGQGRIVAGQRYHAVGSARGSEQVHTIRVYLPCRTAMVLRRR